MFLTFVGGDRLYDKSLDDTDPQVILLSLPWQIIEVSDHTPAVWGTTATVKGPKPFKQSSGIVVTDLFTGFNLPEGDETSLVYQTCVRFT